jgi:choline kinase
VHAVPVAVLAAGRGNRLSPLTDDTPKCLLSIGDSSALGMLLDTLDRLPGISEVVLVVGHAQRQIATYLSGAHLRLAVRLLDNPDYDTANNIVSAHLLAGRFPDGFLLVNSDVVCHPDIVAGVLAHYSGSAVVVDPQRPPRDEAMKVRFEDGRLVAIAKTLDPSTADGEYIGITRFDRAGAAAFFRATRAIVTSGGTDEWYEAAIARAAGEVAFGRHSTAGLPWIEIDDPADLDRARRDVAPRLKVSKSVES